MRTLTAERLNIVANHPEVRPFLGWSGELDLTQIVENTSNFCFETDGGGFLCLNHGNGIYQAHSLFIPEKRGVVTLSMARDVAEFMFVKTDCIEMKTLCPDDNPAAKGLAEKVGFERLFHRHNGWNGGGCGYYSLRFDRWKEMTPSLIAEGQLFHEWLEAEKRSRGSRLETHEEDQAHDRAVGAASLMFKSRNVFKAVSLYNIWADFAGYLPISLLSVNPCLIDIGDAIISVDEELEVLRCR